MTHEELRQIEATVAQLCDETDPVSFYDAIQILSQLPRGEDLPDSLLDQLVGLHDADHATDGARDTLTQFLRGYATRLNRERAAAQRPITPADAGTCVRAPVGSVLCVHLEERRGLGYRWQPRIHDSALSFSRRQDPSHQAPTVEFRVELTRIGRVWLRLVEDPPHIAASHDPAQPPPRRRVFEVEVVVERAQ